VDDAVGTRAPRHVVEIVLAAGAASVLAGVLKGDSYLRIAVVPAGAPPSLPGEEKLAAAVLAKL
jgi:hypothetical protein